MNPKVVLLGYNSHINSKRLIPERVCVGLQMIQKNLRVMKRCNKIAEIIKGKGTKEQTHKM